MLNIIIKKQLTLFILGLFFLIFSQSSSASDIPEYSRIIQANQHKFHIREMGDTDKPAVVLLSGPNQYWHSDSAWFALLQPYLSQYFHTIVIDRAGHGWSTPYESASYTSFSDDLFEVLQKLKLKEIIILSYASSNISAWQLYQNYHSKLSIKAMLWIDPDIIQPHSIALYSDYPANWYKENINKLVPFLASGKWTEKTATRNKKELEHIKTLIPTKYQGYMDWQYFNLMQQQRLSISAQQTKARDIAHYESDLNSAKEFSIITNIPISIIDTDFELLDIKPDNENYQNLLTWQQEGTKWSQMITQKSSGNHIELPNSDHLVMFEQPALILNALRELNK